jgi:hypothetical protein
MSRRLLNLTILNSMAMCRANSQGKRVDHWKFLIDMVLAVLKQHGGAVERKVPVRHPMENRVPRLLERRFPETIPPTERKSRPTKWCAVC